MRDPPTTGLLLSTAPHRCCTGWGLDGLIAMCCEAAGLDIVAWLTGAWRRVKSGAGGAERAARSRGQKQV